jgi:Glycosyl Hydrolase Family 88
VWLRWLGQQSWHRTFRVRRSPWLNPALLRVLKRGAYFLPIILFWVCQPILISCSWELGTRAQALLELNAPSYSVLSPQPLPPSPQVPLNLTDSMNTVFSIAHNVVANRTISNGNITGPQPLINDTSAGDPASIGIAVLLASYTGQWAKDGLNYAGAAQDQLDFLFEAVPHTSDGAISHLVHEVQLWVRVFFNLYVERATKGLLPQSDSVYMVPPFLAYYGVIFQNATIVFQAYNQIRLYRSYLLDSSANNLWRHVLLGAGMEDQGHWSTGMSPPPSVRRTATQPEPFFLAR